jgi:energy-coupling factor transporter transmembrane protein EcfT
MDKPNTTNDAWIWLIALFIFPIIGFTIIIFLIIVGACEIIVDAIRTITKRWLWDE